MISRRAMTTGLLGLALGLPVAACGRKAANLPPSASPYPRTYPAPRSEENDDDNRTGASDGFDT